MMISMLVLVLSTVGPGHYGLIEGRAPVYQRTYTGDLAETFTATIRHIAPAKNCELFSLEQQNERKRFLGASAKGLYEFYAADMPGTSPDVESAPTLLLKADPKKGETWTWIEPFRGQTSIGPGDQAPDMKDLESHCKALVVAVDEKLTTPAGSFKAVHVKTVRTSKHQGASESHLWVAPNVGIVKETYGNERWTSEMTLIKV